MIVPQELGYLALAVVQAGAYIFKSECSLNRYLELYRERRGGILEEYNVQQNDDYKWTVYTTWSISFRRLSAQSVRFLQLCAYLHHDGISEAIFRNAASNVTSSRSYCVVDRPGPQKPKFGYFFKKRTPLTRSLDGTQDSYSRANDFLAAFRNLDSAWDSQKFMKMITEIRSYSLIEFDIENQTYSIHPLVHAWIHTTISDKGAISSYTQWILGMSITRGRNPEDYTFRRTLQPHMDYILERRNSVDLEFCEKFRWVYSKARRWKEAEKLQLQVMNGRLKILGPGHPDTLSAMGSLAKIYWNQGLLKEAEELGVQVRGARFRMLGAEHPDTLWAMANLAATYKYQGRWKEAEELEVQVRDARLRKLGAEHPHTLLAMGKLAATHRRQGRWKEAEELEVQVRE